MQWDAKDLDQIPPWYREAETLERRRQNAELFWRLQDLMAHPSRRSADDLLLELDGIRAQMPTEACRMASVRSKRRIRITRQGQILDLLWHLQERL